MHFKKRNHSSICHCLEHSDDDDDPCLLSSKSKVVLLWLTLVFPAPLTGDGSCIQKKWCPLVLNFPKCKFTNNNNNLEKGFSY